MKQSGTLVAMICLLLAASSLYGQNEFRPGYIIGLDQDTIYGQIKANSESRNARICVFRTGKDAEESLFEPGEISAYRIEGGKYYISATVEEDGANSQVFLEYLVNGMADLYYLRKENSEIYYIRKEGEDALAITDIRLLKAAFSDCYEIQSSLDKATLSHRSLVDMTVKYHDYVCDGELCINYTKEASRLRLQVGPAVGFSMTLLSIKGDRLFELFDFDPEFAPVFGILLNIGSSRLGEHVSFQVGAEYCNHSFQGNAETARYVSGSDHYTYDVHLGASQLSFQMGSRYAFSGSRVRPSLGGGLEFSKFLNPDFYYIQYSYVGDNVYTTEWHDNPVGNPLFGAYLQAGLDVKLSRKLVLTSAIRGGFLTSNRNVLAGGTGGQISLRPELIPVSFHIGILF